MPGTYILKPVEANLTHDTDLIGKMNPYCAFIIGGTKIKSQVCKKGGKQPHWNDTILIPVADESLYPQITVQLMDKERLGSDDNIGDFILDLQEVQSSGQVSKWYPISFNDEPAGEILLEASYQSGFNGLDKKGKIEKEEIKREEEITKKEEITREEEVAREEKITREEEIAREEEILREEEVISAIKKEPIATYTEQRQIIEPHTFLKEVETVETRAGVKEIEVMEPVKVIKQVQVTEPVHITKMVEVTEPEVVVKEVEVMEQKLVTKTIQVVEDVPVIRQVEVVEMKTTFREVDTIESRTYDREVEVIEYVPVKRLVQTTEPVTVKRAVEYVEPIITTKTITKEIPQAVVVSEEIDVSVGPATVIDARGEKINERALMKQEALGLEIVEVKEPVVLKEKKMIEEEVVRTEKIIVQTVATVEGVGEVEKTVARITTDSI